MLDRFHTKLHRYNHFTNAVPGYADSASDPIAAPQDPFQGDFHVVGTLSSTYVEGASGLRIGRGTNRGQLATAPLTAFRVYTFPNATGTVVLNTTINPLISALSAVNSGGSFVASSTIWVDSLSGNDSTGQRERADKPFQTLITAQGVANPGDLIYVRHGVYNGNNLGVNGVNWLFEANATVSNASLTDPIFVYSGMSYNVYGSATFSVNGNVVPTAGNAVVADFGGSNGTANLFFEFSRVLVTSSATPSTVPTTSVFKGTFGSKNVHIKGRLISAPLICVFDSFKTLNSGVQNAIIEISEYIAGQTIFNGSLLRLSTYVNTPIISASDYVFNDATVSDTIDRVVIEADEVYGSITKTATQGPIYFDVNDFIVSPAAGVVWSTTAAGLININANSFITSIPIESVSNSKFDLNNLTITNTTSSGPVFGFSYGTLFEIDADMISVNFDTTEYSLFYTGVADAKLIAHLGEVTNVPSARYDLVYTDGVANPTAKVFVDQLINGANFHFYGQNSKFRVDVKGTPDSFFDIVAHADSTDSTYIIKGYYNTLSASNVQIVALSGQAGTKLFLDAGTGFISNGGLNLDIGNIQGTPIDIYIIGNTLTNNTPLDIDANYNLNCGQFETASDIVVPSF